ncbi:polysaccharide biosynthesis tyrosine autokinase [Novosphingobium sp. MBES04]|uniref:polysaccharide biosynthesis tyrosine autokinase n=1 Tax=Novosphingobium sp. MBES04 TaxID=1206458 RepID=UPI00057F5D44|nr:polysaccharide biosynthesis tyrosine autokinase [Novosphingobium sp. MBES04]
MERLLGERARLEAELADESSKHRANYPSVVGLKAQLTEINARIQSIGQSIKKSIQLTYEAASQREANLRAEVEQLQKSSMDEQNSGVQYNLLKRVADTNRSLYDTLLARFNQLNAASGAVSNNITVVDYAEVPTTPSSPKMLINLVIALLIGLVVSALVILLREYFDDAIRSPEDVERKLGIPLLALVPNSEDVQSAISNVRSPVAEAYHTLVANLSLSTQTGLPRVLMLTSSKESEGKSSSCEAIARDLAALGKSVLLVDADLRRPTLHSKFCDRKAPGLSAYLTGNASFEEVLQPSGVENLTCITALPIPLQPSLLLGGVRLGELVARARAMFDVVILDCPPMLGLSDTASISAYVDGVLVVIDAQAYHRGAVKSVLRRLQLTGAPVLGVALTKFDTQRAHGQYSYYGNNYYQYGDASKA